MKTLPLLAFLLTFFVWFVFGNTSNVWAASPKQDFKLLQSCEYSNGGSTVAVGGKSVFLQEYSCRGTQITKNYDPALDPRKEDSDKKLHLDSVYLRKYDERVGQVNLNLYAPNDGSTLTLKTPDGQVCAEITVSADKHTNHNPIPMKYVSLTESVGWQESMDYLMDNNCQSIAVFVGNKMAVMMNSGKHEFDLYKVHVVVTQVKTQEKANVSQIQKQGKEVTFLTDCNDEGVPTSYHLFGKVIIFDMTTCRNGKHLKNFDIDLRPKLESGWILMTSLYSDGQQKLVTSNLFDENNSSTVTFKHLDGTPCAKIHALSTRALIPTPFISPSKEWERSVDYLNGGDCKYLGVIVNDRAVVAINSGKHEFNLHRLHFVFEKP